MPTTYHRPAEQLMGEALNALHASDDLAERALAAAQGSRGRTHHGHARPLAVVAGMALSSALVLGGGTYAIAQSGFFAQAFGGHGFGAANTWTVDGTQDGVRYTREYGSLTASESLEAATQAVGLSTALGDATLTIENMVIDANGAGAATFTLTSESGFNTIQNDSGELVLDGTEPGMSSILMATANKDGNFFSTREVVDSSTPTEIRGTLYFAYHGSPDELADGVAWTLTANERTSDGNSITMRASTEAFTPSNFMQTRAFTGEDGLTATLSSLSLKVTGSKTGERAGANELLLNDVALKLADGSASVIEAGTMSSPEGYTSNTYVGIISNAEDSVSVTRVLSKLADVDATSAITFTECTLEGTEQAHTLTPVA